MQTHAIDHVNILTDDLDATAGFYADVLGLTRADSPLNGRGMQGAWMRDAAGNAIVHLVLNDAAAKDYGTGHATGTPTGSIHHVAFRCDGFAEARAHIAALGLEHQVNDGILGLHQIVLKDPNAIRVELNFPEV
jgi:catechol 2,3-dioxygenase-like lactoylglutathione lyase family enzyme